MKDFEDPKIEHGEGRGQMLGFWELCGAFQMSQPCSSKVMRSSGQHRPAEGSRSELMQPQKGPSTESGSMNSGRVLHSQH